MVILEVLAASSEGLRVSFVLPRRRMQEDSHNIEIQIPRKVAWHAVVSSAIDLEVSFYHRLHRGHHLNLHGLSLLKGSLSLTPRVSWGRDAAKFMDFMFFRVMSYQFLRR